MSQPSKGTRVGELRPSQLVFTFGIGALVDLPHLSVLVCGLDDWDTSRMKEITEERLLRAVRDQLGPQVQSLRLPPAQDLDFIDRLGEESRIGAPVVTFPRWMRCTRCDLLAPIGSELFEIRPNPMRPDRVQWVHRNCNKAARPPVVPARFLVACERGHLDDFPWKEFVHHGPSSCNDTLRLKTLDISGGPSDLVVWCDECSAKRSMAEAFGMRRARSGSDGDETPFACTGRRPHLRDRDPGGCDRRAVPILAGASNLWFPIVLSTLYLPKAEDELPRLVEEHWEKLAGATSIAVVQGLRTAFLAMGLVPRLWAYDDATIFAAIEAHRNPQDSEDVAPNDLKWPEWRILSDPKPEWNTDELRLEPVPPPPGYADVLESVVLVERIREVRALTGFTRIESPGDYIEEGGVPNEMRGPVSRAAPHWVLASEVRGEGVFLRFREELILKWLARPAVQERGALLDKAHRAWRAARKIEPVDAGFPGMRFVLLHTLSHALIHRFAIECGYSAAGIRERIYARGPDEPGGPMAGILLYTAAPDSEGTLGGLVSLGWPETLSRHLDQALERVRLCSSDPLCAEHDPTAAPVTLHGAACHACLFAPETSCERGNKYLDRTALIPTVSTAACAFFDGEERM